MDQGASPEGSEQGHQQGRDDLMADGQQRFTQPQPQAGDSEKHLKRGEQGRADRQAAKEPIDPGQGDGSEPQQQQSAEIGRAHV